MSVKKKIDKNEHILDAAKYIAEGAPVITDHIEKSTSKTICLRLPENFLNMIDSVVNKRVGMNRNAWILQAIQERLEKLMETPYEKTDS